VAKKGAICPIFEGDMPLLKNDPKSWLLYYGHNMKAVIKLNIFRAGNILHLYLPGLIPN
jgi:hypothetical protein